MKTNSNFSKTIYLLFVIAGLAGLIQVSGTNTILGLKYPGGSDRNHNSILSQIDTKNQAQLEIAWTYSAPGY